MLHLENAYYEGIEFVGNYGYYILLNTPNLFTYSENWAGLSGSPVINQNGGCIGVLCSVMENSHSIWVKPFEKIKPLLDSRILQENLNNENSHEGN